MQVSTYLHIPALKHLPYIVLTLVSENYNPPGTCSLEPSCGIAPPRTTLSTATGERSIPRVMFRTACSSKETSAFCPSLMTERMCHSPSATGASAANPDMLSSNTNCSFLSFS